MTISAVEEVSRVSSCPMLESMVFDTDIYDGVAKMSAATILGEIVRLNQHTKNTLNYVYTNLKYGHLVAVPASETH